MQRVCVICGSVYKTYSRSSKKTCSKKCRYELLSTTMKQKYTNKENHPKYGKRVPDEVRAKISKSNIGKVNSKEHREKISIALTGEKQPLELVEKRRLKMIGRPCSEEKKQKISVSLKGQPFSEKRKNAIREGIANTTSLHPTHWVNPRAIPFFEELDKILNSHGFYGNCEYYIKELGYWPDYINFEKKLIIEWDEKHHYSLSGLRTKDLKRQQEIQSFYPDFRFCRIRESYYLV